MPDLASPYTSRLLFGRARYTLAPFDIIPEAVFGVFGLLDDLLFAGLMLMVVAATFREQLLE